MSDHPHADGCNTYYMDPSNLKSLGINVDERCTVCGEDQKNKMYFVDSGLIHCVNCAIKHDHTTKQEYEAMLNEKLG